MRTLLPHHTCHVLALALATAMAGGCGSGPGEPNGPEWVELIGRSWTLAAGSDSYECRRIQASTDWNITGFRGVLPPGQSKLIVTTSASAGATGDFPCDFSTPQADTRMIYSAGVGTGEIVFPSGVGIRVSAGEYVTLMLHVVNPTAGVLTGTTSVVARASSAADVTVHADMTFAGTVVFSIPASGQFSVTGGCTASQAWTVFALLPSLKKLGTHVTVTRTSGGVPLTLHDDVFDPAAQDFVMVAPAVTVATGDAFAVTATWVNTTGASVTFGPDPDDEWAFTGVYRYPAAAPTVAAMFGCVN